MQNKSAVRLESKCLCALMVLSVRSQIRQISERYIRQSGFFEICYDTRYGMGKFFSCRFKIPLYGKGHHQINQGPH